MIANYLMRATNIKRNEIPAAVLSFVFVLTLMAAYYLLRPVRDAMASDWSDAEVSWLWTLNFFISTLLVALYGFVVSKIAVSKLIPAVYGFFSLSFVLFYLLVQGNSDVILVDKAFYLWVSVFALFHVSVFWTFMADTFNKEQAARLFSVIAAGASIGAILGPALSLYLAKTIGEQYAILVTAAMLLVPLPLIYRINILKVTDLGNAHLSSSTSGKNVDQPLEGSWYEGFKTFITNPYLLGIGVLILLYTGIGSFVYFELKNLLVDYSRADRTAIYSMRDIVTNSITFIFALFLTGRIVTKLGMPIALSLVPILMFGGMLVLAISPVLIVALGVWVARSAGNYGLARPAREMLFTQVSQEDRFKTKPVIDIVAYRGGDVIMGWFFTGLTQGLGLGLAAVAAVGSVMALMWAGVAWLLGVEYEKTKVDEDSST